MPLPEVFEAPQVAKHLGLSVEFVEREARRIGSYSKAARRMLFTAEHVNELLQAWRAEPEAARLAVPVVSEEWRAQRPFTPETLAREWGVSANHVRKLIKSGELPHFKVGRLLRISVAAAREYQDQHPA